VEIKADGLPDTLREYQLYECRATVTNKSDKTISIKPGDWLALHAGRKAGVSMQVRLADQRASLSPGESASLTLRLYLTSKEKDVTLNWRFTPEGTWPLFP
jgi:hypothetical protein